MKFRKVLISLAVLIGGIFCFIAVKTLAAHTAPPAIMPAPEKMTAGGGFFALNPNTRILADSTGQSTADYLAERLRIPTGIGWKVEQCPDASAPKGNILLTTRNAKPELGSEGYELSV